MPEAPAIDPANTVWLLVSTALVLLMTPGLALFYGGLNRSKGVLNMMMMSFSAIGLISVLWLFYGFSLAFGSDQGGIIGNLGDYLGTRTFLGEGDLWGATAENPSGIGVPIYVFMAFQMVFAVITVALISGAISDRTKFAGWLLFAGLWATIVYFPVAHWVWGGGWIGAKLHALDFAGGTGVDVHRRTTGEVERVQLAADPAAAPHPVRDRDVDQGEPAEREDDPAAELHPVGHGTADQRHGDDREHHLEDHHRVRRDAGLAAQEEPLLGDRPGAGAEVLREAAQDVVEAGAAVRAERQAEAVQNPKDRDEPDAREAHHHHVEYALGPVEATVEQRQTRGHEQYERRRQEQPGGIAGVDLHAASSRLGVLPHGHVGSVACAPVSGGSLPVGCFEHGPCPISSA